MFKILYTSSCKEAGIGLQNKAAALHALIQKLSENPDDDRIKDLFFRHWQIWSCFAQIFMIIAIMKWQKNTKNC